MPARKTKNKNNYNKNTKLQQLLVNTQQACDDTGALNTRRQDRRRPFVYSAQQTLALLTAVRDNNPWSKPYGERGSCWTTITELLNQLPLFQGRELTEQSVTDKVAGLLASHERPERTVFTETEAKHFDGLCPGHAGTAEGENKNTRQEEQKKHQIYAGEVARRQALQTYTERAECRQAQAQPEDPVGSAHNNPMPENGPLAHQNPPPPQLCDLIQGVSDSFNNYIQAESAQSKRGYQLMASFSNSLARNAQGQSELVREQKEQNKLLRMILSSHMNIPSPSLPSDSPEPLPPKIRPASPINNVDNNLGEVEEHNQNVSLLTIEEKEDLLGMGQEEFQGNSEPEVSKEDEPKQRVKRQKRSTIPGPTPTRQLRPCNDCR
ncbi:hypothetical protein RSOLAG22IIIB_13139 [Rhizoctonia solani]|uniref:Uncharacterized protein n=1 Tax=Rhizoctonia solani TaxID=456999 RepID=A0A0K6GIS2_9AGAM|nr:hypothetical protein RSOLAG22IIIB_13139 [Rhizoctonia solani]